VKAKCSSFPRSGEAGYAVLLAIFLVASMLLLAAAAAPNVLMQGRRLREQEAIWRGNQYVRAIRLYYQKNGKYPSSLEDLTKANAAGVHFLRKSYREPMNSADGNWRLIYVTASGQLVGSVHYHSLQEMAVASAFAGQLPGGAAGFASQLFGQVNQNQATGAQTGITGQPGALPGQQSSAQPNQSFGGPQAGASPNAQNSQDSMLSSTQPAPLAAVDSPVFGGSVIGVASKVKQPSIMVYQGGKTYFEWEFIWNPLMNANGGAPGKQLAIPGLNVPLQPGAAPNGGAGPAGANGSTNVPGSLPGGMPIGPQNTNPFTPGGGPQGQPNPAPRN
jgi:type II secretory pathway pseudopilin PulG